MGLDNGIVIKTRIELKPELLPPFVGIQEDDWLQENKGNGYWYELCYWRKCWNIRDIVLDMHPDFNEEEEYYGYTLSKKHVHQLRLALIDYISNMYKWEEDYENGRTIWDSSDMLYHLARDIGNLTWLEKCMDEHNIHVEFYDSY